MKVDFTASDITHMRTHTLGKKQPLFRALGVEKGISHILDASAGLGGDLFKISCMGLKVSAYERNPYVFALLADGYLRGLQWAETNGDNELLAALQRVDLHWGNAEEGLAEFPGQAIFFDPMFPPKAKGALSGKEMQALHDLCGEVDLEAQKEELRTFLQSSSAQRLIVKQPLKAQPLMAGVNHSFKGKSLRYDLYVIN